MGVRLTPRFDPIGYKRCDALMEDLGMAHDDEQIREAIAQIPLVVANQDRMETVVGDMVERQQSIETSVNALHLSIVDRRGDDRLRDQEIATDLAVHKAEDAAHFQAVHVAIAKPSGLSGKHLTLMLGAIPALTAGVLTVFSACTGQQIGG